MFVRFVIPRRDPVSHQPQGIFQAAIGLRDSGALERYEHDWIEEELRWLREQLHSPECLREEGTDRAICWFRPGATRAIEKVRSIAVLLEEHGYHVRMLTTDNPGTIIYKDGWQVVAFPPRPHKNRPPSRWAKR